MRKKPVATIEYIEKSAVVMLNTDIISDRQIDALKELIINTVLQRNFSYLLVDFAKCSSVSTSALGLILRIKKKLREKQIRIILCFVDQSKIIYSENDRYAYEIFRVLDLRRLFDICNRPAQAIADRISMKENEMQKAGDASSSQTAMAH